jgi:hypothetical protein
MTKVARCSVIPQQINLGASFQLVVELDGPAPQGGINVAVQLVTDGSEYAIVGGPPRSLEFQHGAQTFALNLQTDATVLPHPTSMTFFADTAGTPSQSATLSFNSEAHRSRVVPTPFAVDARAGWRKGFTLNPGERFNVTANGNWNWSPGQGSVGPGGTGQTNPDMPDPNGFQACLLMQRFIEVPFPVGGNHLAPVGYLWAWTGESMTVGLAGVPGDVGDYYFRINDDQLDDNSGSMQVTLYPTRNRGSHSG